MARKTPGTEAKEPGKAGRPSDYSEAVADLICEKLSEGASLRSICLADDLPDITTVFRWLAKHQEFAIKYARAREAQVEAHYEAMDEIEADVLAGVLDPKAANVVLGNKRWRLEKLKPKVFGQLIKHADAEGNNLPAPQYIVAPIQPAKPSEE